MTRSFQGFRSPLHLLSFVTLFLAISCGPGNYKSTTDANLQAGTTVFDLEKIMKEGPGFYYHLPLNEVLTRSLITSPVLNEFRARVAEAHYKRDAALAPSRPQLDFNATYRLFSPASRMGGASPFGATSTGPADSFDIGLNLRQVIYDFGRIKWSALSAELNEKSAVEEYRRAVNKVIEDVSLVYVQSLRVDAEVRTFEDLVNSRKSHLKETEGMFKNGVVPKFDVLRAKTELVNAQEQLVSAQERLRIQAGSLYVFINELPSDKPIMLDPMEPKSPPPANKDDALNQALYRRPEVASLVWGVKAAEAYVKYAETGNKPTLSADLNVGQNVFGGFQPGIQWSVGIQLNIPIFDGGLTRAQTNQAKERVKQIQSNLEQAKRVVILDVDQEFVSLRASWSKMSLMKEGVDSARELLRLARARFKTGVGTSLEVLDAQTALAQSSLKFENAKHDYLAGQVRWQTAVSADFPVPVPGPRDPVPMPVPNEPVGLFVEK